jgi:N-carbamoylputrescine amidase
MLPLVCANRIGTETGKGNAAHSPLSVTFHGRSFITDGTGDKVAESGADDESIIMHEFDLEQCRRARENWGLFRDRRPAMYGVLKTSDGSIQ